MTMNILAFCRRRLAKRRAARWAKSQSQKIDRRLQAESKHDKQRPHDILLIGSCAPFFTTFAVVRTDCVDSTGTPGSEAAEFATVKRMKLVHDDYTTEQLAGCRSAIWKILLENSRTIVHALRHIDPEHMHSSTKVRSFLYPLSVAMELCATPFTGQL
jgi:hypothetical protein